jgi:hypothetical protein
MATDNPTSSGAPTHRLTAREIEALADRLFSRGISVLSLDQPQVRSDLIEASRTLRALLRHCERATGRQLQTVVISGGL